MKFRKMKRMMIVAFFTVSSLTLPVVRFVVTRYIVKTGREHVDTVKASPEGYQLKSDGRCKGRHGKSNTPDGF
jgi:hypothetical protein